MMTSFDSREAVSTALPEDLDSAPLKENESKSGPGLSAARVAGAVAGMAAASASAVAQVQEIDVIRPDFACAVLVDSPTPAKRLASKATFGYNPSVENRINLIGFDAWLGEQIDYTNLAGYTNFEVAISNKYPQIDYFFYNSGLYTDSLFSLRTSLIEARIERAAHSPAQLMERMVEFWTDHFSTWHFTANLSRLKILEDRDVIRANVFGKLHEMLYGVATSPAMLVYLDGRTNVKTNPNQNFAREFLELHSLGVDNGYDELTIEELAKSLTGWKVGGGGHHQGEVWWRDSDHDMTAKSIVFPGFKNYTFNIPAGMTTDLELVEVVRMLTDPDELGEYTVRFIATRMAKQFIKCSPPRSLITEMWNAYVKAYQTGGDDIAAMVQTMLSSRWINCSGPIFKRPLHLLCSSVRGLNVGITDPGNENQSNRVVGGFLTATGHRPFNWPAPDGYPRPCEIEYWGGNQLERWNLGADMFEPGAGITGIDKTKVLSLVLGMSTNQDVVDFIDDYLFAGFMNVNEKSDILDYINASANQAAGREEALGLAITSPGFQWY